MPLTLDTTVGGAAANAYCSLVEANTYHDAHPYPGVWATATDDQKNRAIATATMLLDRHIEWGGAVASYTQRLLWPRAGMLNRVGQNVALTEIPEELKNATAEFARQLLDADRTADSDIETLGLDEISAGVDVKFNGRTHAKVVPDSVYYIIEMWGRVKSRAGAFAVELSRS